MKKIIEINNRWFCVELINDNIPSIVFYPTESPIDQWNDSKPLEMLNTNKSISTLRAITKVVRTFLFKTNHQSYKIHAENNIDKRLSVYYRLIQREKLDQYFNIYRIENTIYLFRKKYE